MKLSVNRITCPALSMEDFFKLTKEVGASGVELRNDIRDGKIFDSLKPDEVKSLANKYGLTIVSINALQKFNLNSNLGHAIEELKSLLDASVKSGCQAIVLCPNNCDKDMRTPKQRYEETVIALESMGKLFNGSGVTGLVEPLGFSICSLRTKEEAVKAINNSGYKKCYKLVHDTFHHYLGTDKICYPEHTGLLHISGVIDDIPKKDFTDAHRILVTKKDVMDNIGQINIFKKSGYNGYYSFEPFSEKVQKLSYAQLVNEIKDSIRNL